VRRSRNFIRFNRTRLGWNTPKTFKNDRHKVDDSRSRRKQNEMELQKVKKQKNILTQNKRENNVQRPTVSIQIDGGRTAVD